MKTTSIITIVSLITAVFLSNHSPYGAEPNGIFLPTTMSATMHLDSVVLGAGCFWGAEKRYETIPGVVNAISVSIMIIMLK